MIPRPAGACRRHVVAVLSAACWVLGTHGCAYLPQRTPLAPQPLPAELAVYYDYPAKPSQATTKLVRERPAYREWLVSFPLSAAGFEPTEPVVEFEWFESTRPGRRPAILFNPILGGDYPLERGICRFFARRGFHVALVHRKTLKVSPEHPVSRLEVLLRQGVIRIRQIVDWMAAQERVDPERMADFGVSMGGMASVMAVAVEPRLKAHVVVMAGGSLADILMTSRDTLLTKPRQRYLQARGMDLATLRRQLEQEVKTDPLHLAPYADGRRMLLFISLLDRTVGTRNELRLRRALGRPATQFLCAGHYTAYLLLPYLKYASLRFLTRELALTP